MHIKQGRGETRYTIVCPFQEGRNIDIEAQTVHAIVQGD